MGTIFALFQSCGISPVSHNFPKIISKVGGAKPAGDDIGEVLNSAANASATETITEQIQEETQQSL
uniref:Uncharacterized protein n=1 Tax=Chrysemys picta bellii TaxID=8478 RepID=A0A8C3H685_CHRPI